MPSDNGAEVAGKRKEDVDSFLLTLVIPIRAPRCVILAKNGVSDHADGSASVPAGRARLIALLSVSLTVLVQL
jgi:hypothetical protein